MDKATASRILQYVREQQSGMLKLLDHLVAAESPSSVPGTHRLIVAVLTEALTALGFRVRTLHTGNSHKHIFARRHERRRELPRQLLVGHFDTVWPLGTTAQRPLVVADNIVRGPGVFDMKGGLAQIVFALKVIKELDLALPLEPLIFFNSDEEIGSHTSTRYIGALARCAQRAYVLEPSLGEEGAIKTERKGIGRFTVTVHGKSAHAGLDPEGGASAILELSHVIQALFALNDAEQGITVNVGTIDGGIQANVIAPHSRAVVDVRVPTVDIGERITRTIHELQPTTPGVRLTIEGGIGRPSMEQTPRNRRLWDQAVALGSELGLDLQQARAGGGSDGNTTSQYTATLDGLGPVGHGAHADHEFLYLDRTLERTALLALLLLAPPVAGNSS
jgi:glutamate carboxypeptidase